MEQDDAQMIDESKKRAMRKKILKLERDNVNTNRYTAKDITNRIRKIIEDEVMSRY